MITINMKLIKFVENNNKPGLSFGFAGESNLSKGRPWQDKM